MKMVVSILPQHDWEMNHVTNHQALVAYGPREQKTTTTDMSEYQSFGRIKTQQSVSFQLVFVALVAAGIITPAECSNPSMKSCLDFMMGSLSS